MSPESFIRAQLAAFAYDEAFATGSYLAMVAVASVIRNRVRKGWFQGSWMENLNRAADYAPFEPIVRSYDLSHEAFRMLLGEVDDIYNGSADSPAVTIDPLTREVALGLYYYDVLLPQSGRVTRPWFEQKILRDGANHPRIAQVGNLIIFA